MKKLSFFLIVILFIAACNNTTTTDQPNTENTETTEVGVKVAELKIGGMHCASCENSVASALTELDGVEYAKASVDMKIAKVTFNPAKVGPEDFKAAIEGKGYEMIECTILEPNEKPAEPVK
jgi:copper chaperone CopZ